MTAGPTFRRILLTDHKEVVTCETGNYSGRTLVPSSHTTVNHETNLAEANLAAHERPPKPAKRWRAGLEDIADQSHFTAPRATH